MKGIRQLVEQGCGEEERKKLLVEWLICLIDHSTS
jgi:hypothetical protein